MKSKAERDNIFKQSIAFVKLQTHYLLLDFMNEQKRHVNFALFLRKLRQSLLARKKKGKEVWWRRCCRQSSSVILSRNPGLESGCNDTLRHADFNLQVFRVCVCCTCLHLGTFQNFGTNYLHWAAKTLRMSVL